jgi:uncharacterized membrane protein
MPLGQRAGCFELCMIYYSVPLLRYQLRSYGLTTFAIIIMHAMIRILHNSKHKKKTERLLHPPIDALSTKSTLMAVTGKNTQNSPGMRALIKRIGKKKQNQLKRKKKT